MPIDTISHIADRFLIHFYASTGVVLCVLFTLAFIQRRKKWPFLPRFVHGQIVVSALLVFACSTLREAFDVANGQSVIKAVFDYISWAGGCGVSAWGLWRLTKKE